MYAVISKDSIRLLLAYSVYMYPTSMGNLYVRISLFTPSSPKGLRGMCFDTMLNTLYCV
ncbi:hypothetical protein [Desulfurococcus amylolyticus]|uniref:hypothetical protein n=1 Tax=Desulfurococcus amylolyticus TaxID=94694 RepID=UPI0023F17EE0|nr:hypothetical protein [Desulfurococcus amylolyticus]